MIVSKMRKQAKPNIAVAPQTSVSTAAMMPEILFHRKSQPG